MRRLIALAGLFLVGCSEDSNGPTAVHPVSGRVLVGGAPAEGVQVFLYPTTHVNPVDAKMHPHGVTNASGMFQITTYHSNDGAPEGGYQVILIWPLPEDAEGGEAPDEDRLLGWYDAKHSTLTVQVKAGSNELPPFNLPKHTSPPAASQGVPGRN